MIQEIAEQFAIAGKFLAASEMPSGLINTTQQVIFTNDDASQSRYIMQKINSKVFPQPLAVMKNVELITKHINDRVLRKKDDTGGQTLNLYPARNGKSYIQDGDDVWRCYNFITGCKSYDVVENAKQAYQAAHAFGAFQDLVSDFPAHQLSETIPHFHDTPWRFTQLEIAMENDAAGRAKFITKEFEALMVQKEKAGLLMQLLRSGEIPSRVTHNDTKISNVMFDEITDQAVCVIDLDTVMPGVSLYDFGDLMRTAVSAAAEDSRDESQVSVRMEIFAALVKGYLSSSKNFLTKTEIEYLAESGEIITLELASRFLTDYLNGDTYFKTKYAEQNLHRCQAQLLLAKKMAQAMGEMRKIAVSL